ncbi:hypothetical protein CHCC20375_2460 [Bacillus licheniformis]|nr:hypothetical protein CHCC20375_2460 [Bacillus licheniformis]
MIQGPAVLNRSNEKMYNTDVNRQTAKNPPNWECFPCLLQVVLQADEPL